MKHSLSVDSWHENPQLAKWIPFVGPGAAVVLLFLMYVILAEVFTYLPK
jgi:hypothetical protein